MTTNINVQGMSAAQILLVADEMAVRAKYSKLSIMEGSMRQEVEGGVPGKKFVTVVCECGAHVKRYTSDLFTFKGCPTCKKVVSKAEKAMKKVDDDSALKAAMKKLNEMEAKLAALTNPAPAQDPVS